VDYGTFLEAKRERVLAHGIDIPEGDLAPHLFDFQRRVTSWALTRGRAAVFAGTGLGKTAIELEWCRQVGGTTLILAPLAVSAQIAREGEKFGVPVTA
jgi:superfamily II DNA or RNA helicase